MSLRITGKGMDIGDALRERIANRCQQAFDKYFDGTYQGHITVEKESTSAFKIVCILHLSSGHDIRLDEKGHEAYATFEAMTEHLEKKLRRYKRRLKEHSSAKRTQPARSYVISSPSANEEEEAIDDGVFEPLVISEEASSLSELSVGEAVIRLDISGQDVLVFRRFADDSIQIVHRRADGHFGWIDTSDS